MRWFLIVGSGLLCGLAGGAGRLAPTAWAQDPARSTQPTAQQVLARALEAHGGAERLAGFPALTMKIQGTIFTPQKQLPFTAETAAQGKDRFRMVTRTELEGKPIELWEVVHGDRGWLRIGGVTQPLAKEQLQEEQQEMYAGWLATLTPLSKEPFQLVLAGAAQVEGRPAWEVLVRHPERPVVHLFFDQQTGLLVKMAYRLPPLSGKGADKEAAKAGRQQEVLLKEHRRFQGIQQPTQVLIRRDGQPFVEYRVQELRFHERLDDKLFAEP
jgi:hypothetical protein